MSAVMRPCADYVPMHADDIDAIVAIENEVYPFPWSAGNFTDSLTARHSAWLCREHGALIGYAVMMIVMDEAHLLNLSVAAEYQRGGRGGRMLEFLFEEARSLGAERFFLEVRPSNESGIALYGRFGFAEIGRRRGYYPAHGGREDAIVMVKAL